MIQVVNIKTYMGDTKQLYYIGRENKTYGMEESPAANPFKVGPDGWTREQSIGFFEEHMKYVFKNTSHDLDDGFLQWMVGMCIHYQNGEDITLGCWCKPKKCHGDVIKMEIERNWWKWIDMHGGGVVGLKGFEIEHPEFSNFHRLSVPVLMNGIEFNCVENAFQAAKTESKDEQLAFVGLTPGQAKRKGGRRGNIKLRSDWEAVKFGTMLGLVQQKFERNHELAEMLLSTDDKSIVEGNRHGDTHWGYVVGTGGKNKLGLILTMVRHQIRMEDKMKREIFVFGSNLAGRHGKGAALCAKNEHGAIYGEGIGLQGDSYAIPTKDESIKTLPLDRIKKYVDDFLIFAARHPEMEFNVTRIGCGLAGYKDEDVATMFKWATRYKNIRLPNEWFSILGMESDEIYEGRQLAQQNFYGGSPGGDGTEYDFPESVPEDIGEVVMAVVGSRSLDNSECRADANRVWAEVYPMYPEKGLVSGGATGPDSWAEDWAKEINRPIQVIKPDWKKFGKSAGFKRNQQIIDAADVVLIFWDGKSKGTQHDINLAKKAGKDILLYVWENGRFKNADDKPEGGGGSNMSSIDRKKTDIKKGCEQLRFILSQREDPTGYYVAREPSVNCVDCVHVAENDEGIFLRCTHPLAWHKVYNPKMDTYNDMYSETLANYIDPLTGEDATEDEVRNIENREETDAKLLSDSLGRRDERTVKHTVKADYKYYMFCSRLPYVTVGRGKDAHEIQNVEFCPFHQFNQMLEHGKCNQELVNAFYRAVGSWTTRVPKFRKSAVSGSVSTEIIKSRSYEDGEWKIEFENVWVPLESIDSTELWDTVFTNKKGEDTFKKMMGYQRYVLHNKNDVAKRNVWAEMEKFTPRLTREIAEHYLTTTRIPHTASPTAVKDARSVLIQNEVLPVKKAYGMTDIQIFEAYRKYASDSAQMHQLSRPKLEKDERLAMLDGIYACTGSGTVITPEMHEKYTSGKSKTFYFVGVVNGEKMSAVKWNQLSVEARHELLGVVSEGFHLDENTTLVDTIEHEEAFVDWALSNEKRAEKLDREFMDAMRGLNDEVLLKAMTIRLHDLVGTPEKRKCAKCGRKLAQINEGAFCFSCASAYEQQFKVEDVTILNQEDMH
jgi:ribA/ribD-fused uncharacterized protein